jgi:fructosamine-3-kinase
MAFTKRNTSGYDDALICEAQGLDALRQALEQADVRAVRVPRVFRVSADALVMTRIESFPPTPTTLAMLGAGLARMHRLRQAAYGWPVGNYIGLSPQPNRETENWGEFFVRDRLGFQVGRVADGAVRGRFAEVLERQGERLADWLNRHCAHPSLLHGDLWSGNALFGQDHAWLIDPAVYCGDREADLAMTEMFGGFGQAFYHAYDRVYPRTEAYPAKRDLYNLYHYLNHYNLFGRSYRPGCERGFRRILELVG